MPSPAANGAEGTKARAKSGRKVPAHLQALVSRDAQLAVNQGVELINVGAPLADPGPVEISSVGCSVSCLFRYGA